jgi:hypothetical protein
MKPKPLAVLNHLTVPLAISSQPENEIEVCAAHSSAPGHRRDGP